MIVLPSTFLSKLYNGVNWKLFNLQSGSGNVWNGISEAINQRIGTQKSYQFKTIDDLAKEFLPSMTHTKPRPLLTNSCEKPEPKPRDMKSCEKPEPKPTAPRCRPESRKKPKCPCPCECGATCPPGSRGKPPGDGKITRLIIGLIGLIAASIGAYYLRLKAEEEKKEKEEKEKAENEENEAADKPTPTLWSFETFPK